MNFKKISELEKVIKRKKNLIFDFDGVIVDSVDIKTTAFFSLYSEYGSDVQKKVVTHHISNGGMSRFEKINYYHKNFLGKIISKKENEEICKDFSKLVIDKVISAPEIAKAEEFLAHNKNKLTFINTGTPTNEINLILKKRGLYHYFDNVYGSPRTKNENIEIILYKYDLNSCDCIFFGDATSDLNAARYFDIDFVGVGKYIKKYLNKNEFYINNFSDLNLWNI